MKRDIQVDKSHYFNKKYCSIDRFISYFYQIDLVTRLNPKRILEIGGGNKMVSNYLKSLGLNVTTFDFDKNLKPDVVGDITEISKYFDKEEFDVVCCFEVLEHIPFEEFDKSLREIKKITKRFFIFSVPQASLKISFGFKFPLIKRKDFLISFPLPVKHKFDGEHFWELGKRGYSLEKIRKNIKRHFKIVKEVRPRLNPYHRFFVLKK
jgi:hypothetical protein